MYKNIKNRLVKTISREVHEWYKSRLTQNVKDTRWKREQCL